MRIIVRLAVCVMLLPSLPGCDYVTPASPAGPVVGPAPNPSPAPTPFVPALVSFPPLSGPARTFVFDRQVSYPVRYSVRSRFVLYDTGAFALQFPEFTYRGAYREANGTIEFLFDSPRGRGEHELWDDAIGTLTGGSLTVIYEEELQHSDFENAVYVLVP